MESLPSAHSAIVEAVSFALSQLKPHCQVIVDPVMIASSGDELVDTLCLPDRSLKSYTQERLLDINTHGSGCTLSAAIAAWVSRAFNMQESVSRGLSYVRSTMENPVTIRGMRFINHFP